MDYAMVENGLTVNLIVAESEVAEAFGALPAYDGCVIGEPYSPPPQYTGLEQAQQDITDLQLADIEQGQALTDLELMIMEGQAHV